MTDDRYGVDRQPHPLVEAELREIFDRATKEAGLDAPVTPEMLLPDDNGVVMFPPEVVDSIARMDAARSRLRELGVRHVDLGQCSHGWVAGVKVQRGRAHREVVAHGAPIPAQALEELALQIEALPPEKRRKGRRGR